MPLFAIFISILCAAALAAETVTVSNTQLRRTRQGNVVLAQDGNIANALYNGSFVLLGMSYGDCAFQACANTSGGACGFGPGRFLAYLSPTLGDGSWSEPIEILPASQRPATLARAIFFRPHLVFNPRTQQWVLWVRYLPPDGPSLSDDPTLYLTATAPSLDAAFSVAQLAVPMYYNNSADNNLFVDADGTGYLVHTSRSTNTAITVERLSDDFTWSRGVNESASRSALVGPGHTEAPALARFNGRYILTFSPLCCFCVAGSPAAVYAADAPLGPYAPLGGGLGNAAGAQQTFLFAHEKLGAGALLWAGNRWGSDPVNKPPHFDNSLQFWTLLQPAANGSGFAPIRWQDTITLSVS